MKIKKITFIDLFSGIGGFRLAFEEMGAKCVFSSDIDANACKTYQNNFNQYPLSDITKIKAADIPNFDIMCAGFPCQPFSIAGKRKGFQDTRGTLFFDIERILRNKKPKAFLLENVKGLLNHDRGNTIDIILNTLAKKINNKINKNKFPNNLGYNVFLKVLNSKDYGLPQNRERVYIIGFLNQNIQFNYPKKSKNLITLDSILTEKDSKLEISKLAKNNILNNLKKHKNFNNIKNKKLLLAYEIRKSRCSFRYDGISPTLTAKMGTGGNNVPVLVNKMRKFSVEECLRIQGFPKDFKIEKYKAQSYKQIGNSVSVPVVTLLAREIINNLDDKLV